MSETDERERILDTLEAFVAQRPGMQPREYISDWRDEEGRRTYRRTVRAVGRDLNDARALIAQVRWRTSIGAPELRAVLGADRRLTWDGRKLHYTAGQYMPTEYRAAVCSALASALWAYFRENGCATADDIRAKAKRELGKRLAAWIN